ncbi:hypothetical protein MO973_25240 [Paenibacillus sp. TRM 82003]|nr:hypothetical protein [Paenibacillus sp. TRM 82003]
MIQKLLVIGGVAFVVAYGLYRAKIKPSAVLLDELAARYSEGCDKLILEEIEKGVLRFISGRLTFAFDPKDERIVVASALYFQNERQEWFTKSHEERLPKHRLTSQALEELKGAGEIVFEIDPPQSAQAHHAG